MESWPSRRVVVLGASNAVRGISTLIQTVCRAWGGPLDLRAAIGHGRGYVSACWVLGRTLPPIVQCGLWESLADRPTAATSAMLTDIGNDLLYGVTVGRIAHGIETCLERLASRCERITVTSIPIEALQRLTPRRYELLRTMLFPTSRLTREDALSASEELNGRVKDLAARFGADVRHPFPTWYGFDPIHIRRACYGQAWREFLAAWYEDDILPPARGSWWLWFYLHVQRPQQRGLFGFAQHRVQPTCRLRDGTLVSLY